jgi:hypothetical protein
MVADAQQDLGCVEWLADEILGAKGKSAALHISAVVGGDHDHRHVIRAPGTANYFFENRESILLAHVQVEKDQIRIEARLKRYCFDGIRCRLDVLVTGFGEDALEQANVLLLIVDDEETRRPDGLGGSGG